MTRTTHVKAHTRGANLRDDAAERYNRALEHYERTTTTPRALPRIRFQDKEWIIDERLNQVRDAKTMESMSIDEFKLLLTLAKAKREGRNIHQANYELLTELEKHRPLLPHEEALKVHHAQADTDKDGAPDIHDCDPEDPNQQGVFHSVWAGIKLGWHKWREARLHAKAEHNKEEIEKDFQETAQHFKKLIPSSGGGGE